MKFFIFSILIALAFLAAAVHADKGDEGEKEKEIPKVDVLIKFKSVNFYNQKHKVVNKCDVVGFVGTDYFKIYNCKYMVKTFGDKMYTTVQRGGYICHGEIDPHKHPEKGYYHCVRGGKDMNYKIEAYAKNLTIYTFPEGSKANVCNVKFYVSMKTDSIVEKNKFEDCQEPIADGDAAMYGKFQTPNYICKAKLDPSVNVEYGTTVCVPKYKPCKCMNPYYNMKEKEMKKMMKSKYKLVAFVHKVTHDMYKKAYCKCF